MQNVSAQLAGKVITGLPCKWSTGESVGCGLLLLTLCNLLVCLAEHRR